MTYCTCFYSECPATGVESQIEIIFSCAEEEEKESFWGYPVAVPASNEIEILEVFKNGQEWTDYSNNITTRLLDEEWTPCECETRCKRRNHTSKSINLIPCKKRLAA